MSNIKIIHGSCIDQNVDAVVNATNKFLMSGGGICGAIYQRAGYEKLNEECRKYDTPLNDGDAIITPAFNLKNAKYIIHSVGPDFGRTPEAINKLFNAYYNSMKLLKENNLHSVSFPLISSGIYGGNLKNPARISAEQCIKVYSRFIEENSNYEINVLLCVFLESEMKQIEEGNLL